MHINSVITTDPSIHQLSVAFHMLRVNVKKKKKQTKGCVPLGWSGSGSNDLRSLRNQWIHAQDRLIASSVNVDGVSSSFSMPMKVMTKNFQLYWRLLPCLNKDDLMLLRLIYNIHIKWYVVRWNILSSRLKQIASFQKRWTSSWHCFRLRKRHFIPVPFFINLMIY